MFTSTHYTVVVVVFGVSLFVKEAARYLQWRENNKNSRPTLNHGFKAIIQTHFKYVKFDVENEET